MFFKTTKCCCQVHVQATSLLKRNKHWNAFRVWLYEKQVHLGGYMSDVKGDVALTDILKRNGMNKNRYEHFRQPVKTKIMQIRMYQFKLTKS